MSLRTCWALRKKPERQLSGPTCALQTCLTWTNNKENPLKHIRVSLHRCVTHRIEMTLCTFKGSIHPNCFLTYCFSCNLGEPILQDQYTCTSACNNPVVWLFLLPGDVSQDAEGPQALCDLCLAQVCRSLDSLCSRRADGSMSLIWAPLLPQETADQLLHKMATTGRSGGQKGLQKHQYQRLWETAAVEWQFWGKL